MMTLLRGLHAIAAQRGDGMRPELLKAVLSSPECADIDQAPRAGGHDAKPFIVIHGGQGDTACVPSLQNSFKR